MTESTEEQRAQDIHEAGKRVGIPISTDHSLMATKWSESLNDAFNVVRATDYEEHEPSNVFNPMALDECGRCAR